MPLIQYDNKRIGPTNMAVVGQVNAIVEEYRRQGYTLTLRQVYYQLVSRALLDNTHREYKRLGKIVGDGRLAGLIDWLAIEDRTRSLRKSPDWGGPGEIVGQCAEQFRLDLWAGQGYRPEVWIEKDALVGVLEVACEPLRVPHFSCRGYTSESELWVAAQRLAGARRPSPRPAWGSSPGGLRRQTPVVFHLGDHDPSGIDMTRDIERRLKLYSGGPVEVVRLALNMEQVDRHQPPPNPAKATDSRIGAYRARYGDSSWELDALDPATITATIREALGGRLDRAEWDAGLAVEVGHKAKLHRAAETWDALAGGL